jgi:hypothetical protein
MGRLGIWLLATSTLSGGCLSFCHPIGHPPPEQVLTCGALPPGCRNHVYVFFLNGIDPLGVGNFAGLREYVQALGFIKSYYGQLYHKATFAKEIRRLRDEDPLAHFVIVGYKLGVNTADDLANDLRADGILVDLIVYVGGSAEATPQPGNAGRVVHVMTHDWFGGRPVQDGAVGDTYADVSVFGAAAHRRTLETLAQELWTLAISVPVLERPVPAPADGSQSPTMPRAEGPADDWDFLRPRLPYGDPPISAPATPQPPPKEPVPPSSVGRL